MHVSARGSRLVGTQDQTRERSKHVLGRAGTLKLKGSFPFDWRGTPPTANAFLPQAPLPSAVRDAEPSPRPQVLRAFWTDEEEHRCRTRCRRCGQVIIWGEVVEDLIAASHAVQNMDNLAALLPKVRRHEWVNRMPSRVGRFVPLDPDGMPHRCNGKRKTA